MPTVNFFTGGTKRKLVPIYVRLIAGKGVDLIIPSGLLVNPAQWSNKTQTIKQRIRTEADEKFIKNLSGLKEHLINEVRNHIGEYSKQWLKDIVNKHFNKRSVDAETLNQYIERYVADCKSGERKNKNGMNFATGTIQDLQGFKLVFDDFQGIYSPERIQWRKKNKKPIRELNKFDFDSINIDFYHGFVSFLVDEGFNRNTMGRFIKDLKMFMKKSLEDKLHSNREFQYNSFRGFKSESFSVYLTKSEIDKIYAVDLSSDSELDIARDAFLTLCETALRISDYKKVDVNIRTDENGMKLIYITQTKTKNSVIIPLSARLETILEKHNGELPRVPEQYINRRIKIIAKMCGIDEILRWETEKYGKRFEKIAHKWEKISCHSARRSACTNMYLAGISTLDIRQISGHRTESSFLRYIKISKEETAVKLSTHPYFRNSLKVV